MATLSARSISKGTGASRATARKWIDGKPLSPKKQRQIDAWAREHGVLLASDLLRCLPADQHHSARGLLNQFALHYGVPILHTIHGSHYLDGSPSTEINAQFKELI